VRRNIAAAGETLNPDTARCRRRQVQGLVRRDRYTSIRSLRAISALTG
jgi:hypothetical protein